GGVAHTGAVGEAAGTVIGTAVGGMVVVATGAMVVVGATGAMVVDVVWTGGASARFTITASTAPIASAVTGNKRPQGEPVAAGAEARVGTVCVAEAAALAPGFEADSRSGNSSRNASSRSVRGEERVSRAAEAGPASRAWRALRPAWTYSRSSARSAAVA